MTVFDCLPPVLDLYNIEFGKMVVDLILQRGPARCQSAAADTLRTSLLKHTNDIFAALYSQDAGFRQQVQQQQVGTCTRELRDLVDIKNGWHFSAIHATSEKIEDFSLDDMGSKMKEVAPHLFGLLDMLVHAGRSNKRPQSDEDGDMTGDTADDSQVPEDPELWAGMQYNDLMTTTRAERQGMLRTAQRRLETIRRVVSPTVRTCESAILHDSAYRESYLFCLYS